LNVSDKIQIRSTPGCGKTTLARHLQAYIQQQEPNEEMLNKGWKQWLKLKFESGTVLIVDEAQPSYWTSHSGSNYKISTQILHAAPSLLPSYEGAGHNIYDPMTPFHISPQQNIGLVPVDHGDQIAVFFSRKPSLMKLYQSFFKTIGSTSG